MQRAELRQYKMKARAQIELLPTPRARGTGKSQLGMVGLSALSALTLALSPYRHRATKQILQSQDLPKLHKTTQANFAKTSLEASNLLPLQPLQTRYNLYKLNICLTKTCPASPRKREAGDDQTSLKFPNVAFVSHICRKALHFGLDLYILPTNLLDMK